MGRKKALKIRWKPRYDLPGTSESFAKMEIKSDCNNKTKAVQSTSSLSTANATEFLTSMGHPKSDSSLSGLGKTSESIDKTQSISKLNLGFIDDDRETDNRERFFTPPPSLAKTDVSEKVVNFLKHHELVPKFLREVGNKNQMSITRCRNENEPSTSGAYTLADLHPELSTPMVVVKRKSHQADSPQSIPKLSLSSLDDNGTESAYASCRTSSTDTPTSEDEIFHESSEHTGGNNSVVESTRKEKKEVALSPSFERLNLESLNNNETSSSSSEVSSDDSRALHLIEMNFLDHLDKMSSIAFYSTDSRAYQRLSPMLKDFHRHNRYILELDGSEVYGDTEIALEFLENRIRFYKFSPEPSKNHAAFFQIWFNLIKLNPDQINIGEALYLEIKEFYLTETQYKEYENEFLYQVLGFEM